MHDFQEVARMRAAVESDKRWAKWSDESWKKLSRKERQIRTEKLGRCWPWMETDEAERRKVFIFYFVVLITII